MFAYFFSLYQELVISTIDFLPTLISGLIIFILFYIAFRICGNIFDRLAKKSDKGWNSVLPLLKSTTRITLLTVGLITMLGTWGVDVSAIIAGLGITGFALGFALKDALASLLAGTLILIYRPFRVGDTIDTCGVSGIVFAIDMRYTTIDDNGIRHLVPNSKLLSEKVSIGSRK